MFGLISIIINWRKIMKELSIYEIHEVTLSLLIRIKEICNIIGVKYYLAYGTLLGAVRHKGFIPWDDDADLWMHRTDYDIFFKYLNDYKDELYPISFCSRMNTKNYPYAINRVTDMRYKYIDTKTFINVDYGVFVDIYPLDFAGNEHSEYLKKYKKIEKLNTLYFLYLQNKSYGGSILKSFLKRLSYFGLHCVFKNQKQIVSFIEKKTKLLLSNSTHDSKLLGVVIWWAYVQSYDKALFEGDTLLEFEGEKFCAPKHYKELLTLIYGDYMKLPPLDQRAPYHGYKIFEREKQEEDKNND